MEHFIGGAEEEPRKFGPRYRDLNGKSHLCNGSAPRIPGPEILVFQLKAGEKVEGIICSPAVWGVVTHWNPKMGPKGRSERCTMDKQKDCSGCGKQLPERWKGYLHCYDFVGRKEFFVEITPAAFDKLISEAPEDGSLRGKRFKGERTKGGNQGRLNVELGLWAGEVSKLPPPRDPEPILEILWRWGR